MNQNHKKLSRRDAIKLLGAATGATLLANLPSKWSKPSLMSGVLPAHAQTSGQISFSSVPNDPITCGGLSNVLYAPQQQVPVVFLTLQVAIAPQMNSYPVGYQMATQNISVNISTTGTVFTGPTGVASLNFQASILDTPNQLQNTFTAPQAPNPCTQTVTFVEIA